MRAKPNLIEKYLGYNINYICQFIKYKLLLI